MNYIIIECSKLKFGPINNLWFLQSGGSVGSTVVVAVVVAVYLVVGSTVVGDILWCVNNKVEFFIKINNRE